MGKKIAIMGTVVLILGFMAFMWVMVPYFTPDEEELPGCEYDMIYAFQGDCNCYPDDHKWVVATNGWVCVKEDFSLPNCNTYPYETTLECECMPPGVWDSEIVDEDTTLWYCND